MIIDMDIKRFEIESNGIWEWRKKALSWRELCDILNELYEENLRLKEYIKETKDDNTFKKGDLNESTLNTKEIYKVEPEGKVFRR